jgi:hypothetical protein
MRVCGNSIPTEGRQQVAASRPHRPNSVWSNPAWPNPAWPNPAWTDPA